MKLRSRAYTAHSRPRTGPPIEFDGSYHAPILRFGPPSNRPVMRLIVCRRICLIAASCSNGSSAADRPKCQEFSDSPGYFSGGVGFPREFAQDLRKRRRARHSQSDRLNHRSPCQGSRNRAARSTPKQDSAKQVRIGGAVNLLPSSVPIQPAGGPLPRLMSIMEYS